MASRRKQPESIALLSMYNDDEEDEEMEGLDEGSQRPPEGEESEPTNNRMELDSANDLASEAATRRAERGRVGIVDYGHDDEVAMSPEGAGFAEYRETDNADASQYRTSGGVVRVLSPGVATPQLSELSELPQAVGINSDVDLLDGFLPPTPKEKCPKEPQKRIERLLDLKVGRNAELRNSKDFRNPDFLLHEYQDIDQIGFCFSIPHGYEKSDYFDEIELDMIRERERREQELKKSPKADFVYRGTQPGLVVPHTKFSVPGPGVPASQSARDGRQSKKSKWDTIKVKPDGRNSVPSGRNSANFCAGYTAYVQQKKERSRRKKIH